MSRDSNEKMARIIVIAIWILYMNGLLALLAFSGCGGGDEPEEEPVISTPDQTIQPVQCTLQTCV